MENKSNVRIIGNGRITAEPGSQIFMHGASGESIEDGVHFQNSGTMMANNLSIVDKVKFENSGTLFSSKMKIGKESIHNWTTKHPWFFMFLSASVGFFIDRLLSIIFK